MCKSAIIILHNDTESYLDISQQPSEPSLVQLIVIAFGITCVFIPLGAVSLKAALSVS